MNVSFFINNFDIYKYPDREEKYKQLKKDIKATIINNISTFDKREIIEDIELIYNKNELLVIYNEEYTSYVRRPESSYIFCISKDYKSIEKNKYYLELSVNMLSTYRNIYEQIYNQIIS